MKLTISPGSAQDSSPEPKSDSVFKSSSRFIHHPKPLRETSADSPSRSVFGDLFYIGVHFLKGQELEASFHQLGRQDARKPRL